MKIAVICEGPSDYRMACDLIDRVLCENVDFLEFDNLSDYREWHATSSDSPLLWKNVRHEAESRGIRTLHGHSRGPDAQVARRALLVISGHKPDAIVLLRDLDDQPDRATGIDWAIETSSSEAIPTVRGMAMTKRESWVLNGFRSLNGPEELLHAQERRNLGFDPVPMSHLLDAKDDLAKRSAKRVLSVLTQSDFDRERACWVGTPLDALHANGTETGLSNFLNECRSLLCPAFDGKTRS